jgi:hypothetical protein
MKGFLETAVFALAMASLFSPVEALNFTDTDFSGGTHFQTAVEAERLVLANESPQAYFLSGNFTSRVFDAGFVVEWSSISWKAVVPNNETVNSSVRMQTSVSNDSLSWGNFSLNYTSGDAVAGGISRYIRYRASLESNNTNFTPFLDNVSVFYQLIPPVVSLDSPQNNFVSTSRDIEFNCSAYSPNSLKNITLYTDLNGSWSANQTVQVSGSHNATSFSFSGIPDGSYTWNCMAADETGQEVFNANTYTLVVAATNPPPLILSYNITPQNMPAGSLVFLGIEASDTGGIDSVWAEIVLPDSSRINVTLVNGGVVNYTVPMEGNYLVVFFANDTAGGVSSAQGSFRVSPVIDFTANVEDFSSGGVKVNLTVLKDGEVVSLMGNVSGNLSGSLLADTYDLLFSAFGGDFDVLLKGVDVQAEAGKTLGLDRLSLADFEEVFAVRNPYSFVGGEVKIRYDESLYSNESYLEIYVCSDWNFTEQACNGDFSLLPDFEQNKSSNEFKFNVSGFSAFGLRESEFCGDGICGGGESTSSCPADCECSDGETQSCGTTDTGECELGVQTCLNGTWGPCTGEISPVSETCNQKDDDCDGIVDNVFGGDSIETTKCQCFGGPPADEVCNGIDDDCDGQIDGFSKACGSNIGICREGMQFCENGVFGECTGGVTALSKEVCNNGEDDNCDGNEDEGCPDCFNGIKDGDEEGIDCGGSCSKECAGFPYYILAVAGVAVLAVVTVFLRRRGKSSWEALEKRYSYSPR